MQMILAGRNRTAIETIAAELVRPSRIFALDSPQEIAQKLEGAKAVVHCAGPFSATAEPMMDACLKAGAHYMDITGEIEVIEAGAARDRQAQEAGITLMPAVGFDVVPSDCLAATLADALPDATHLELAITTTGGLSPGTAKTMVEGLPDGGRARIDGRIERVPMAWKEMDVPFRDRVRRAITIPWGDVASAYYTTGIPNIEVYLADSPAAIKRMKMARHLFPLLRIGFLQRFAKRRIERSVHGPTEEDYENARSRLWGRVRDGEGRSAEATMETPSGYKLTVLSTLAVLDRVLEGEVPVGFQTPAGALGRDFVLSIPGTDVRLEGAGSSATT
jgi:short subunit dehydrogenase-like uncharacterized protein